MGGLHEKVKAAILGAWMAEELSPSTPDKLTRAAIKVVVEQCAQECEWEAVNFKRAGGSVVGQFDCGGGVDVNAMSRLDTPTGRSVQ